jgi:hypothetical protein
MKRTLFRRALIGTICLGLVVDAAPSRADTLKTDADEIIIGGVAIIAAIGVGIFFAVHHGGSIKGCAATGPDGLEIRTLNGASVFELSGATAEVKAGDLVRVKGKKKHGQSGDVPRFVVSGVAKDYGPCAVAGHP